MTMAMAITLLISLISSSNATDQTLTNCSNLVCKIQEMKHKVGRLELVVEMNDLELHTKTLYIERCEKKIDELQSCFSNLKDLPRPPHDGDHIINALEKEVRELEFRVTKNDKELSLLKLRTKDAENSVKLLSSQLDTMAKIVPELWFHVQKLEQAQIVIQRRTAELRRHIRNHKCSFFKFINNVFSIRYQEMASGCTSELMNQLRWSFYRLKKYHHQLQGFVKQEMERNELTSVLADDELVFILASAIIVFPLALALVWLSSLLI